MNAPYIAKMFDTVLGEEGAANGAAPSRGLQAYLCGMCSEVFSRDEALTLESHECLDDAHDRGTFTQHTEFHACPECTSSNLTERFFCERCETTLASDGDDYCGICRSRIDCAEAAEYNRMVVREGVSA